MKLISLTQGQFAQADDWNYNWLNQWKWHVLKCKCGIYYAARVEYIKGTKPMESHCILMHRLIMNTPKDHHVDHIDHNGLNCLEDNMRNCLRFQNMRNRRSNNNHSSQFRGVCWFPRLKKWRAYIGVPQKHLGYHSDEINAAKAYDAKAKELYGEFANLNFK